MEGCNGNGRCYAVTGFNLDQNEQKKRCACNEGYSGVDCLTELKCPLGCSGPERGVCSFVSKGFEGQARCECSTGFYGEACERSMECPVGAGNGRVCGGNGMCRSTTSAASADASRDTDSGSSGSEAGASGNA